MIYYSITNLLTDDTLDSVSTEHTVFVKENLYNQRQSKPFRWTAKSNNEIKINLGGAAIPVTIIGLMNHNLTKNAIVTLRAALADQGNLAAWQAGFAYEKEMTWNETSMFEALNQTFQWWHIEVDDAGNSAFPEFGEFHIGTHSQFTMNYKWPFEEGANNIITESVTKYKQRWRGRIAKQWMAALDFDAITDANLASEMEAFFDEHENSKPFLFVPETTEANCWYILCLNDYRAQRNFENLNAIRLDLEEQTRGVSLL